MPHAIAGIALRPLELRMTKGLHHDVRLLFRVDPLPQSPRGICAALLQEHHYVGPLFPLYDSPVCQESIWNWRMPLTGFPVLRLETGGKRCVTDTSRAAETQPAVVLRRTD